MPATLKTLLEAVHESIELSSPKEIVEACELIIDVQRFTPGERDTLRVMHQSGPLFDGDIPSKTARDSLLSMGYVAKIVAKGQDGQNACTQKGHLAYLLISAGA